MSDSGEGGSYECITNGQAALRLLSRSKPDTDEVREALESMIAHMTNKLGVEFPGLGRNRTKVLVMFSITQYLFRERKMKPSSGRKKHRRNSPMSGSVGFT